MLANIFQNHENQRVTTCKWCSDVKPLVVLYMIKCNSLLLLHIFMPYSFEVAFLTFTFYFTFYNPFW